MPTIEAPMPDFLDAQTAWFDEHKNQLGPEVQIRFGSLLLYAEELREKAWMYDELCD